MQIHMLIPEHLKSLDNLLCAAVKTESALKGWMVCNEISKTFSHVEETCKGQGLTEEEVRGGEEV